VGDEPFVEDGVRLGPVEAAAVVPTGGGVGRGGKVGQRGVLLIARRR
jgi:hypothetical protein